MDRAKKVVVIGDVFADMISKVQGFPETGGRTFGTSFMRNRRRDGAGNIAAGLAVLGMRLPLYAAWEMMKRGIFAGRIKAVRGKYRACEGYCRLEVRGSADNGG